MKNKILLAFAGIILSLSLVVGIRAAVGIDPVMDFGVLRGLSNGVMRWFVLVNSSNQLDIVENANINGVVMRLDTTDGSLLLRARTGAQLKALTPTAQNELIVNSDFPALCISSGVGNGAWITATSSGPVGTQSLKNPCF